MGSLFTKSVPPTPLVTPTVVTKRKRTNSEAEDGDGESRVLKHANTTSSPDVQAAAPAPPIACVRPLVPYESDAKVYFENGAQYLPFLYDTIVDKMLPNGQTLSPTDFEKFLLKILKEYQCKNGVVNNKYLTQVISESFCRDNGALCFENIYVVHQEPNPANQLQITRKRSAPGSVYQFMQNNIKAFVIYNEPVIYDERALLDTFHVTPAQVVEIKLICSVNKQGAVLILKFMERMRTKGKRLFILEEADKNRDHKDKNKAVLLRFYEKVGFVKGADKFRPWLTVGKTFGYDPYERYMYSIDNRASLPNEWSDSVPEIVC